MAIINVNVTETNYQPTGISVSVPQVQVDLVITWDDDSTTPPTPHSTTQTVKFPNILSNAGIEPSWLKDHLQQLLLDALRHIAGADA